MKTFAITMVGCLAMMGQAAPQGERPTSEIRENPTPSTMGEYGEYGLGSESKGRSYMSRPAYIQHPDSWPKYIKTKEAIISWTKEQDVLWGFSQSKGSWSKQEIKPPPEGQRIQPVIGGSAGVVQVGNTFYAYSAQEGTWDTLKVPDDRTARVAVDSHSVLLQDGEMLYVFASSTGKWAAREDVGQRRALYVPYSYRSVAHAIRKVTEVAEQRGDVSIVDYDSSDYDSSGVVIVGSIPILEAAYVALEQKGLLPTTPEGTAIPLSQLLRPHDPEGETTATPEAQPAPTGSGARMVTRPSVPLPHTDDVTKQVDLGQLESQLGAAARKLQEIAGTIGDATARPDDGGADRSLRRELQRAVADVFDAKQALQQARLRALRARLAALESQVEQRDRRKQELIDRDVEQLLESAPQPTATAD